MPDYIRPNKPLVHQCVTSGFYFLLPVLLPFLTKSLPNYIGLTSTLQSSASAILAIKSMLVEYLPLSILDKLGCLIPALSDSSICDNPLDSLNSAMRLPILSRSVIYLVFAGLISLCIETFSLVTGLNHALFLSEY